ncbi:hypothetical protein [Parachitinimonas caeni]|uniref:Uncharacterized protein n=1 Tax=Parachitinimonas caeni TaxID=3031301 RepID=A0ABT7DXS5_9NEIS|nr:hypothetical protein [Parachitinimonas caeni]MDK2123447.1 hypothetical protein [Parachitinimonas caeni]
MTNLVSMKNFSANMSLTLQEQNRLLMNDVQKTVDRLDRKREAISQAGLQRLQDSNATAAKLSEQRTKIDVYV